MTTFKINKQDFIKLLARALNTMEPHKINKEVLRLSDTLDDTNEKITIELIDSGKKPVLEFNGYFNQ